MGPLFWLLPWHQPRGKETKPKRNENENRIEHRKAKGRAEKAEVHGSSPLEGQPASTEGRILNGRSTDLDRHA